MKKSIAILSILCMVFVLASCTVTPDVTQQPTASNSTTEGATQQNTAQPTATPEPTAAPTPSATEETDKLVLESFDNGAVKDLAKFANLSTYGISATENSIVAEDTESGSGLKVFLNDTAAWCQSISLKASMQPAFASANQYSYVRLWVNNKTDGTLAIGFIYNGNGKATATLATNAVAYSCDGTKVSIDINDASGMGGGTATAVVVPADFIGWIAFPVDGLTSNWGGAVGNITDTDSITLDIRPSGMSAESYYIIDEFVLVNSPYGKTRVNPTPSKKPDTQDDKKEQIATAMENIKNATPVVKEITEFKPTGVYSYIKAITYDGMDKNGKKTKVFAYIGFPEKASATNKVPAIVLVHGGGGHAFLEWVKMWNDRGYAAIAMDNTGYFPTAVNAGNTETNGDWAYGLKAPFKETGYTNAPNNDGMNSSNAKIESQWMYHAVGQTIIANNILRADERVDSNKIGITGISWGGVITSITIGYDERFAFAVPIYGSGYLEEAKSWMKDNFAGKATQALWSAADRFDKVKMPVLWLCWNDDSCFSINSNSKSYLDTKANANTRLSMVNNMYHSHGCGWAPAESMVFADSVVKGGAKLPEMGEIKLNGNSISCSFTAESGVSTVNAKLYYITAPMTYSSHVKYGYEATFMDQTWKTNNLTVDGNGISGTLPADAVGYYIELRVTINGKQVISCTPYTEK